MCYKVLVLQHLSDIKFKSDEYYEYPDNEERGKRATMQLNLASHLKDTLDLRANNYFGEEEPIITDTLDKSMYQAIYFQINL